MKETFGQWLKKLVYGRGDNMTSLGRKFYMDTDYMSKVANDRCAPPERWAKELPKIYDLSEEECDNLERLIFIARCRNTMDLRQFSFEQREAIVEYAWKVKKGGEGGEIN